MQPATEPLTSKLTSGNIKHSIKDRSMTVSYTHLDVYKRQDLLPCLFYSHFAVYLEPGIAFQKVLKSSNFVH